MNAKKWISVEEKLPIRGEDVLIYEKYQNVAGVAYMTMHKIWAANKDYVDISLNGEGVVESDIIHENVTHWMPLPEPPNIE